MVRTWAEEVLQHELPGYYTPAIEGMTFLITHVGPDKFKISGCYPQENEPREFLVHIDVTEL